MFPKFSVVVSRFRCQSPDGRHFAFNMGFFDNTEHGTCAELGEFSTHNPTHKMLDAVEVRSSSLLVPTIFLHHLASLTSLRKAPNGSIKRADPEGMMFRTSSNPTSGEFWAAHFYGTGVIRPSDGAANAVAGCWLAGLWRVVSHMPVQDNVTSERYSEHYVWVE